jgi:hypothetical protein
LRNDKIVRLAPFHATAIPSLVAGADVDGLLVLFREPAAHFKSTGEMRRAAVHAVARLPLDPATTLAQSILQLPQLESYGLEQPVLEQLAITLFKHRETEKAQHVLKALIMRKKSPSVHVFVAMIEAAVRPKLRPFHLTYSL